MLKPTTRYRPKADRSTLFRLIDEAHSILQKEWIEKYEDLIAVAATEKLKLLYPPEEMAILHKYRAAHPHTKITIRLYNKESKRWDTLYCADIPIPVLVPNHSELSALHPDWWDEPLLGITPEYRETMPEEEWNSHVARTQKGKLNLLPMELDYIFESYLHLMKACHRDMQIGVLIDRCKKESGGVYPTWGEIVDEAPALLQLEEFSNWGSNKEGGNQ